MSRGRDFPLPLPQGIKESFQNRSCYSQGLGNLLGAQNVGVAYTEQRRFGTWPNPVHLHSGIRMDSKWERESRNLGSAPSYGTPKDVTECQWSLFCMGGFKDREKMTRLLFRGVSDNDAKKGMVAVERLSCCCMRKVWN